jgi:hypothetical protein
MVDPVEGATDGGTRRRTLAGLRAVVTTVVVDGLAGCLLVVGVALLFGLLAVPWVASGFFFYNAALTAPAASRYQEASSCAADGSTGRRCVQVIHGTIAAVNKQGSFRTASVNYQFSMELPNGLASASVSDFVLVQPPAWPQVGQAVDVKLYEGTITEIGYNGLKIDTNANPLVHEHDLFITGLFALAFGIVLDGAIFIGIRRRRKASGPPPN